MSDELVTLLPCPFCGSTDVEYQEGSWRAVICEDCPAYCEKSAKDATREQIIAAWNQRSPSPHTSGTEQWQCKHGAAGREHCAVSDAPGSECLARALGSTAPVVAFYHTGRTIECGHCHPEKYEPTNAACCICHDHSTSEKNIESAAKELNRSIFEQTGCGLNALAAMRVLPILRKYFGTEGSI